MKAPKLPRGIKFKDLEKQFRTHQNKAVKSDKVFNNKNKQDKNKESQNSSNNSDNDDKKLKNLFKKLKKNKSKNNDNGDDGYGLTISKKKNPRKTGPKPS